MLAYEKCYALTSTSAGSFNNCIAAHEPKAYSTDYPITQHWWNIPTGNCSRAAELVLSNGEATHVPAVPNRVYCENRVPPPHTPYEK